MFHALKTSIITGIGFAAGSILVIKAQDILSDDYQRALFIQKANGLKDKLKKRFF